MKLFKRSVWSLTTLFFGIAFAASLVGQDIATANEGWINSTLKINPYIQVDDSENTTPDVMYYTSPFIRTRWHLNAETGKYELETKKNSELIRKNALMWSRSVDEEGSVLLKNDNQALPLTSGAKVSLFGISQDPSCFLATGQGSGYIAPNFTDSLVEDLTSDGVEVNPKLADKYSDLALTGKYGTTSKSNAAVSDSNYVEFETDEVPYSEISSTVDSTISEYGDAAIFILSRLGSENGDTDFSASQNCDNNYMDLTLTEAGILTQLTSLKESGKIKKIILVLNTCNAMQFKNIAKYDVDSILQIGTGGTASFLALSDVLTGKADPNGHLADTYLYDSYSNPATVNFGDFTFTEMGSGLPSDNQYTHNTKYVVYQEGIYVGYKYYETRYEDMVLNQGNAKGTFGAKNSSNEWTYNQEVIYPFGYGSSYATFEESDFKVVEKNDSIICSCTIKNTSETYSGKDVFQVYVQKPYTQYDKENGIEQSSVNLAAFAKTKLLKPGEQETLNVTIDKKDLATYDANNKKTYILEAGDYYISMGNGAHDALNNILTKKGKGVADGMDAEGDSSKAFLYQVAEEDDTTYSKSVTGKEITNRFDDVDINKYEGTSDQHVTYLSRNDWQGTYPTKAVKLKCTSSKMIQDMQYGSKTVEEDPTAVMPQYNQENGLSLIDLLYDDFDDEKWNQLLDEMSFEEQCRIVTYGANAFAGADSISAPGGSISDGPAGVRNYKGALAYPNETIMASTFNTDLVKNLGIAWGYELLDLGCNAIYGPGAGIHRSNLSGRNWEYFSEDGILSGFMLDSELAGLTSEGVICYTKHCILNDQERNRYGGTVWANEQSIREIYLTSFEKACESSSANGIMSSFNRLGCTWAGGSKALMRDILRTEWGFKGTTITDAAVSSLQITEEGYVKGVLAGQTMWLGGAGSNTFGSASSTATVRQAIRKAVKYNLYTQLHSSAMNGMKSGIRIVEVDPWWKSAIHTLAIVTGVLTGICFVMTIISFLLPLFTKKKEAE